ncbi:putative lipid II flippase FtsW [Porticoccus hydrocarbonoclasticus]|jgi:cell division protein FtsW|uniref:putative lipid II flippase FtsW n=1 Tax=Porticoccus TaxID=1123967 RepID=UPI0023534777|nr:putative lipid II flippase FtsW [Porticoccus hydrocarbonoclasticus]|tara:strand:+ start:5862 stop:7046 length:1185 start_codon:yes stop_codon:yes gene_type:complete
MNLAAVYWPRITLFLRELDQWLLLSTIAIATIGLVMISSASISFAEHNLGDGFYFLKRQMLYMTLGLVVAALFLYMPSRFWYHNAVPLLVVTIILLVAVLIPGIGRRVNGAQRWIPLGPINLQVSEVAKFMMILFMASYLERYQRELREYWKSMIRPVLLLIGVAGLLLLEPDFGSMVVVCGTVLAMLFIGGAKLWLFSGLLLAGIGGIASMALISPYRLERLVTFLDPWAHQYDSGYQLTQSLIAFGRGEWFGVGLGNSIQKLFFLPEAHTDFVFSIYAEEFGLIGVAVVLGLYSLLVSRIVHVARKAVRQEDWFAAYSCFGIAIVLAGQAFINIGVTSGLLPTKGLTLPFISYGGSSLLVCCAMVALVLRISREMDDVQAVAKQVRRDRAEL